MMKKICLIQTGGTIEMEEQNGVVAPNARKKLIDVIHAQIGEAIHVDTIEMFQIPSPHMTPEHMLTLGKKIQELQHYDGVVITHGTDTLEETAYFLELFLDVDIPVVLTGAMRSSNEVGSDGAHNLLSAIRVCASDVAASFGALVVFNDEIHSASNVTKAHASNVAAFQSPQYGPLGSVTKQGVYFHHKPLRKEHYPIANANKRVLLLKAFAGMDDYILQMISAREVDGLVIEAFGQGNLPPATLPGIKRLLAQQLPIVIVSRCINGTVQDVYDYDGGGRQLKDLGIIFSNGLSGQKARIKLMMALELTKDITKLQQFFQK